MNLGSKRQLKEYEIDLKNWYKDLKEEIGNEETLLSEIELVWYSRYGITDKAVLKIDRKYLPPIYKRIKSVYPDMARYFKEKMMAAGAVPSIFS